MDLTEARKVRSDVQDFVETLDGVDDKHVLQGLELLVKEYRLDLVWGRLDGEQ